MADYNAEELDLEVTDASKDSFDANTLASGMEEE